MSCRFSDFLLGWNMPSRRAVALIILFWLAITGYVAYRDIWPVLFASGPPPIAIELADEAAQNVPVRWTMTHNGTQIGRLLTQMRYVDADDTFRFTHDYKQLKIDGGIATVFIPELQVVVRISRDGDLKEQSATGKLELRVGELALVTATAEMKGVVTDGQLASTLTITSPFEVKGKPFRMNRTLDPVPVPKGQPLNPMQPVNRIAGVTPGRQWVVHESNPLDDAIANLAGEFGAKPRDEKPAALIGEVQSDARELRRANHTDTCWVIEYRREGELQARTWVRTTDGKVLKQEAYKKGDTIALERDE